MTGITEAAQEAFKQIAASEDHIFEDRVARARRLFVEAFGEDIEPKIEEQMIIFEFDDLRLVYTGSPALKQRFVGKGWNVLENCAKCKQPQAVRNVATLAQLGRYLHEDPVWECRRCNPTEATRAA